MTPQFKPGDIIRISHTQYDVEFVEHRIVLKRESDSRYRIIRDNGGNVTTIDLNQIEAGDTEVEKVDKSKVSRINIEYRD